jgi:parallel beta-helix repeat protein
MRTTNLTVSGNYAHHNQGPGLWTDWDNKWTTYENNTSDDNFGPGIFHEASYDAVIRNNIVRRNGFGFTGWIDGSGILLNSSANTEIYGNTLERNMHGIGLTQTNRADGAYGAHLTQNVNVHDNAITTTSGGVAAGLALSFNDPSFYTSRNNRFQNNRYTLCAPAYFAWGRSDGSLAYIGKDQWTAAGNDTAGTFASGC